MKQAPNNFNIVSNLYNRYEVMGLAAEPYTTALGATPGVHNIVDTIDLATSGHRTRQEIATRSIFGIAPNFAVTFGSSKTTGANFWD